MYFTTYCNQNKRLSQANPPIKIRSILKEREREKEKGRNKKRKTEMYIPWNCFKNLSDSLVRSLFRANSIILTSINDNLSIAVQKDKQDIVNGMGLAKRSTV